MTISLGNGGIGKGASGFLDELKELRIVADGLIFALKEYDIPTNQCENLNFLVRKHNRTKRQLDVSIHTNLSGDWECVERISSCENQGGET